MIREHKKATWVLNTKIRNDYLCTPLSKRIRPKTPSVEDSLQKIQISIKTRVKRHCKIKCRSIKTRVKRSSNCIPVSRTNSLYILRNRCRGKWKRRISILLIEPISGTFFLIQHEDNIIEQYRHDRIFADSQEELVCKKSGLFPAWSCTNFDDNAFIIVFISWI